MAFDSRRQRTLLWSFIVSIALCAVTGIYCLLLDSWGPLQERILGSTAGIAFASVFALASTIPWQRHIWHPIGPSGCVAAAVCLTMILLAIWTEVDRNETFNETMAVFMTLTIALPSIGLLGIARLKPVYAWVRGAAVLAVAVFELMVIVVIFLQPDADWWGRALGIGLILSASGLIATPILHRISGLPTGEAQTETADLLSLTCPRCGAMQTLPLGPSNCSECGLNFRIEVEA